MSNDDRFDGLYLNVVQQARGIDPLLDSLFSFLRRQTDFFAGPPGSGDEGTSIAVDKALGIVQKHASLYQQEQKKKDMNPNSSSGVVSDRVVEMGNDGGFDQSSQPSETPPVQFVGAEKKEPESSRVGKKAETQGKPPVGNGGTTDKYMWTQTLEEVQVTVPLPPHTRGRDLKVELRKQHLKVALIRQPGAPVVIDAPLVKPIVCDDSFWMIEDNERLVLNLQKLNAIEWWDGVCRGDPTINVRDIQPESSKLGDLDGETRKTVEKMMYDQRQKSMGLPTSDEEHKQAMFDRFKQQHPELDFSNAKIT